MCSAGHLGVLHIPVVLVEVIIRVVLAESQTERERLYTEAQENSASHKEYSPNC